MPHRFLLRAAHSGARKLRLPQFTRLRWTVVGMAVAALIGSPLALGATQKKKSSAKTHPTMLVGARNPKSGTARTPTSMVAKTTNNYALRVSDTGVKGGAGIFSCSTVAGGTAAKQPPCLRTLNRGAGSAFEFSFQGTLGGVFQVGTDIARTFPAARPFVTNATGVATGLNADRLDGLHAQDIIDSAVDRSSVKVGAQGPAGPAGPAGQRGPQGIQGQSGPPGTPLVTAVSTPAGTYAGKPVVLLTSNEDLSSAQPTTAADGDDLLAGRPIQPLDPGTYLVQVTVRAFDVGSASPGTSTHYGVAGLFLDGALQTTLWTADVPADGNNAATASDTAVVTVRSGDSGMLALRGVVHTDAALDVDSVIGAGATVIVTQVNPGS